MTYLKNPTYDALVDKFLKAGAALDPRSEVIELLGEIGNVWPERARTDDPAGKLSVAVNVMIELYGAMTARTIQLGLLHHEPVRLALAKVLEQLPRELVLAATADLDREIEQSFADIADLTVKEILDAA